MDELDDTHLNLVTSLFACLNNPAYFFELPDEFRYPLNFAAACLGDGSLLLDYYIDDAEYFQNVNEFISLLSAMKLNSDGVEGINNMFFNFN